MNAGEPTTEPERPWLDAAALRRLCDFLYRRTGMQYGESKRYFVERRVAERMAKTRTDTAAAYLNLLHMGSAEAERLINSFTINETYFYRESHQFDCLGRSILPEVVRARRPGDLIRLWSLPCSTGEEPYSLALWLLEKWRLVDAYNIEIVGSDIDTLALQAAVRGVFGARSTARLPPEVLAGYFEAPIEGERRIIQDLRESVRFVSANLVDARSMAEHGRFDVIFCRNVLIYFDDAARSTAADHLFDALVPGGFLCLGHTETMTRISDRFAQRRFPEAIVYQRPVAA